tara:strand:- start:44 stop:262 length:219 start_codon:yes stop_codon:yes gene_type:complete
MKIKLKGICININKSRDINKLQILRSLCINEMKHKDVYKGKSKLLSMIIETLDKRISIQSDTDHVLELGILN